MTTATWSMEEHALHRYFLWANRHREHFWAWATAQGPLPSDQPARRLWFQAAMAYFGYWFASLYVVVEGWRAIGLNDEKVEEFLKSPNVGLLRRFRNGVFHYQRDYVDRRLTELMRGDGAAAEWAADLHDAFSKYFLRRLTDIGAVDEMKRQIKANPEVLKLIYRPGAASSQNKT